MILASVDEILAAAGGIDDAGLLRDPMRLWQLLAGEQALTLRDARQRVAGEIRLMPSGGGAVHHDLTDDSYWLLSPEELEDLAGVVQ